MPAVFADEVALVAREVSDSQKLIRAVLQREAQFCQENKSLKITFSHMTYIHNPLPNSLNYLRPWPGKLNTNSMNCFGDCVCVWVGEGGQNTRCAGQRLFLFHKSTCIILEVAPTPHCYPILFLQIYHL